jgi:hypothetical protein
MTEKNFVQTVISLQKKNAENIEKGIKRNIFSWRLKNDCQGGHFVWGNSYFFTLFSYFDVGRVLCVDLYTVRGVLK